MQINHLNPVQLAILESFAGANSQEELDDITQLLRDFYAKRLEMEMQRLWDNGKLDGRKLEGLRSEHLRTPYREKN